MSFDLYVCPPPGPHTVDEVRRLLAEEERRLAGKGDSSLPPPGHSSIVLTADTYTSVLPDAAHAAAE
jgi:hypothetical protein